MRLVAAVLCGAFLIVGCGCRPAPSEEARVALRAAQSRTALLARLDPRQQRLFTTLEHNRLRPTLRGMVRVDVAALRGAIERGAAIGGDHLNQLANLGGAQADLWLRTPAEKRVFVAGALTDGPTAWQLAQTLRADGYESFIYDFCQGRGAWTGCPSEIVGAYLGTAGHALVGTSDALIRSRFVRDEANAAQELTDVRRAVLITPTQAATIGGAAATDFVAVDIEMRLTASSGGGQP